MTTRTNAVTGLVAAGAALAAMLLASPDANADVSECWAHLDAVPADQKTTPAGDRRYHLERGEPSPCTEQDAQDGSRDTTSNKPRESYGDSSERRPEDKSEGKSRYCRRHWYC